MKINLEVDKATAKDIKQALWNNFTETVYSSEYDVPNEKQLNEIKQLLNTYCTLVNVTKEKKIVKLTNKKTSKKKAA